MKYTLGLDFGTMSVRALIASRTDGAVAASCAAPYDVVTGRLPTGAALKPDMALAIPRQYREAMIAAVRGAMAESGLQAEDIAGIGLDTTSCSCLPVDESWRPLCETEEYVDEPHAYIKLWKSHSAVDAARHIQSVAEERSEAFLPWTGRRVSSEWLLPKAYETFLDAPGLFARAAAFVDLPDYITYLLSGEKTRNVASIRFKALATEEGLPSAEFLTAIAPGFAAVRDKLKGRWTRWGDRAGGLTEEMAQTLGLCPGISVAGGALDGNIPVVSLNLCQPGDMLLTLGTSGVLAAMSKDALLIDGIAGGGKDCFVPGYYGYEAGMAAMGDLYGWMIHNTVPARYEEQAREAGLNLHAYLSSLALTRAPRADDPLALDWWNGHRGPFKRMDVKGVMMGLSLDTRPEDIYRALVEATAFCARLNLENYERQGLIVQRIGVCGGIGKKNPALMQLFADVLGRELALSKVDEAAALGSAILAAASIDGDLPAAAQRMCAPLERRYIPNQERHEAFEERYQKYLKLSRAMQEI